MPSNITFTTCEDSLIFGPLLGPRALGPGGAPAGLQRASHTINALCLRLRLRLVMRGSQSQDPRLAIHGLTGKLSPD